MRFPYLYTLLSLSTLVHSHLHPRAFTTVPQYAKIPAGAKGPEIDPAIGYYTAPFGGGAYIVSEGVYQAVFLVSTSGVVLIDAPPTLIPHIRYAIGNLTSQPVTHLIYSHSHADHISGAAAIKSWYPGVKIIGHTESARRLKRTQDPLRPVPDVTFDSQKTIQVGNQTVELAFHGTSHAGDTIFAYAPKQKLLVAIDVVFPGWVPFSGLAVSENIPGWVEAHDEILKYGFEHFVGGHLTRAGNRKDVKVQKEYIQDLMHFCKQALEESGSRFANVTGPVAEKNPGNPWAIFEVYLKDVTKVCDAKVSEKWLGVLAAQDVFGFDNAWAMIESLRIDWGVLGPFGPPS